MTDAEKETVLALCAASFREGFLAALDSLTKAIAFVRLVVPFVTDETDNYTIARSCAFATPQPVGWGSDCGDIMSHDAPLNQGQWHHLLNCGVIRTDAEVRANDDRAGLSAEPEGRDV